MLIARWTIGDLNKLGIDCLVESINSFSQFHDIDPYVCFNGKQESIKEIKTKLPKNVKYIDQRHYLDTCLAKPTGVAWKLYPPRIAIDKHEIVIDNDIVINERIEHISIFSEGSHTLLLEDSSRTYGRFEKHVPIGLMINSGLYGMPPMFDFQKFVSFYGNKNWEENALGEHKKNVTFDEQGLVALSLSSWNKYVIIPSSCITNCEQHLVKGSGHHFIGLNRRPFHRPYRLYKCRNIKLYL